MRDAVRVALLARPGAGGDRLREALRAAGADLVLDADPTTLAPETLAGAGAESVVVVLDAAVEDALDRLDPVLHDPAIDVLYEESEVAAAREGWDVARWTRHLSAKLLRHGDVLPPGREADVASVARAAPPAPADETPPPLADEHALAPPTTPPPVASAGTPARSMFDPVSAEYEPAGSDSASIGSDDLSLAGLESAEPELAEPEASGPASSGLELPDFEMDGGEPAAAAPRDAAPHDEAATPAEPDWSTLELAPGPSPDPAPEPSPGPSPEPGTSRPAVPTPPAAPPVMRHATGSADVPRSDAIRDFRRDLAGIEQRIASMGLVDVDPPSVPAEPVAVPESNDEQSPALQEHAVAGPIEPPPVATGAPAAGAVLVFAGIGGPDAVRQFLGALPEGFPRAVLIHQRLDGGRHDRLVQQMARATSLPVQLAADNEPVAAGHVYILPPGLGLADDAAGLRFVAGGDPMATLPPGESAVLMFSGSDTALVDAAMDHARAGALVAGQSPEDCYDAAAADALVARGAESGQPADLARRLAERWAA